MSYAKLFISEDRRLDVLGELEEGQSRGNGVKEIVDSYSDTKSIMHTVGEHSGTEFETTSEHFESKSEGCEGFGFSIPIDKFSSKPVEETFDGDSEVYKEAKENLGIKNNQDLSELSEATVKIPDRRLGKGLIIV